MENTKKKEVLDINMIAKLLWSRKRDFYKPLAIAFVLSCVWIFPQPRYYTADLTLAPEMSMGAVGGLSSLASSFGVNLGNMDTEDAIYPMLYPDVINTSDFVVTLFDVEVTTDDSTYTGDYYTYIKDYNKSNIYTYPLRWCLRTLKNFFKEQDNDGEDTQPNPFRLTEEQTNIVDCIRGNMAVNFDTKTNLISIEVQDQDPLICATMADSIRVRLQKFITEYRTRKARNDYEYYTNLTENAKKEYDRAADEYARYSDCHLGLVTESVKVAKEKLSNDYQQKYSTYTTFKTQQEAALAKIQDRTPAFTMLQGPTVPIKASKPKRMLFVIFMMMLTGICKACLMLYKDRDRILVEL